MNGFYAFCIWTFITCSGAFAVGSMLPQQDLAKDCKSSNEMVISGTVYQCRPVALLNKGVRAELK